jgi:hypothetical protein
MPSFGLRGGLRWSCTFDNVSYDAAADVLYLHVGDPSTPADSDESPEGHALRSTLSKTRLA